MNAFRTLVIGAALVSGAATVVAAQPPAGGRQDRTAQHAGHHARRPGGRGFARALLRDVNLTDAQKTQLRAIDQKYATERRTLMQDVRRTRGDSATRQRPDSATRAQLRTQMESLMDRERGEIRGVLTAEQQKQFDANVAAFRERAKSFKPRPRS